MLVEENKPTDDDQACKADGDHALLMVDSESASNGSNENNAIMESVPEEFDEFFEDYFDDDNDLDSLNVDSWTVTSSVPASLCGGTDDDIYTINTDKKQDLQSTTSPSDMESADDRMQKCLYDIPHTITMKLIRSLDTDMGWESLAAACGFNFDDICELRHEERKANGSPTRSLLWKLGCKAYTLHMLHDKLKERDLISDAEVVATYIMEGDRRTRPSPVPMVSASKNSDYFESYISRISISNPPNAAVSQPLPFFGASNYHHQSTGSEVNFNHQSMVDTSQTKLAGGCKMYEDKFIPGAKSTSAYPAHGQRMPATLMSSQYSIPSSSSSNNSNNNNNVHPNYPAVNNCRQEMPTQLVREVSHSPISLMSTQSHAQVAMSLKASFSYKELATATGGFSANNLLGEGGFGVVYYGHLRDLDCAVKRFIERKSESNKDSTTDQIHNELAALLKYQHENIVTLYGYASDGPQLCLVYQYLSNGSLEDRLMRKNNTVPLSWERRLNILVGSCRAISFLHTMGAEPLIHGDIKSANILLDGHLEAKLADLGQARYATNRSSNTGALTHITLAQSTSRQYGSLAYQAPEIKARCSISTQSDVYAMGVVMLEVCSGLSAFDYNRNENKFITDLYIDHIVKLNESSQVQEFQDKSPHDHIQSVAFLSLLKLARQCIDEIKKLRPKSGRLVKTMKKIYDEQYKEQSFPKSINSPTEDDASEITVLPNFQSHTSERICSPQPNSPTPHSHVSQQQMPSIMQMQEERYQQLSLQRPQQKNQNSRDPHLGYSPQNSTSNSKVPIDTNHNNTTQSSNPKCLLQTGNPSLSIQSPNVSSSDKSNPPAFYHYQSSISTGSSGLSPSQSPSTHPSVSYLHSLSPNQNLPESLMLQQHYDTVSGPPGNQKGMSSDSKTKVSYPDSTLPVTVRNPVEQGEMVKSDSNSNLRSDPDKIAAMRVFDELGSHSSNNSSSNTNVDVLSSPVSLKCDEAKLAYLKNFDDNVFKSNKSGGNSADDDTSRNNPVPNTTQMTHDESEYNNDSDQCCNSVTNPKELEAMSQHRQDYLPASHNYNNSVETEPSAVMNNSQKNDKMTSDNVVTNDAGSSHQQRLANRENMFSYYRAGLDGDEDDDDDDDDDGEENDEEFV